MFAKDFPSFIYNWEEEQEFGAEVEYLDGECISDVEYDMPHWENVMDLDDGSTITKLLYPHPNYVDDGVGYYLDWNEFLGKSLKEVINEYNRRDER